MLSTRFSGATLIIDATIEMNTRLPEKFRDVPWTHLPPTADRQPSRCRSANSPPAG